MTAFPRDDLENLVDDGSEVEVKQSVGFVENLRQGRHINRCTYLTSAEYEVLDVSTVCRRVEGGKLRTKYFKFLKLNPFVFSRWSCNLPGVATMICGFFASATCCAIVSIPPTIVATRTPMDEPRAVKVSVIW